MGQPNALDRRASLEPYYGMGAALGHSLWRRSGVRRKDGLPVTITIVSGAGLERHTETLRRHLKPLLRGDVVDIVSRGDDLFVIWKTLGDHDLRELRGKNLTDEQREQLRRVAHEQLDAWHEQNLTHGPFTLSGIRVNAELTHAWFVTPDLRRVLRGLPPPTPDSDRRLLDIALLELDIATTTGEDQEAAQQGPSAPEAREAEFETVLNWLEHDEPAVAVVGRDGSGKSAILSAVADAVRYRGCIAVLVRPAEHPSYRWMTQLLDDLADRVLSRSPLIARRIFAQSKADLGQKTSTIVGMSERWKNLWGLPEADRREIGLLEAFQEAQVSAVAALLTAVSKSSRLLIALDGIDGVEHEVSRLRTAMGASVRRPQLIVSAEDPAVPGEGRFQIQTLGALDHSALVRLIRATIKIERAAAEQLALDLETIPVTTPMRAHAILHVAGELDWLPVDATPMQPERLEQLALVGGDSDALIERVSKQDFPFEVLEVLAVTDHPLFPWELERWSGASTVDTQRFLSWARYSGLTFNERGRLGLRRFFAEAVRGSIARERENELHQEIADRLLKADDIPAELVAPHLAASYHPEHFDGAKARALIEAAEQQLERHAIGRCEPLIKTLRDALDDGALDTAAFEARARHAVVRWAVTCRDLILALKTLRIPAEAPGFLQVRLCRQRVVLHTMDAQFDEALEAGMQALQQQGIALRVDDDAVKRGVDAVAAQWSRLDDAHPASEVDAAIHELLGSMLPVVYIARRELFPAVVLELVSRSLADGLSPDSLRGLTTLAQLACTQLDQVEFGIRLGRKALEIALRVPGHRYLPVVFSDLANFVLPWGGFLDETTHLNQLGREAADAVGETQYAGYLRMHDALNRFGFGDRLRPLSRRLDDYRAATRGNRLAHMTVKSVRDAVHRLRGSDSTPRDLDDDVPPIAVCIHHLAHGLSAMMLRDDDALETHCQQASRVIHAVEGWIVPIILDRYLRANLQYRRGSVDLAEIRGELQDVVGRVDLAVPLLLHVRALEADRAEHGEDALVLIERSLQAAIALDYPSLQAIAAEDAAKIAAKLGSESLSVAFQRRSARAFYDWGMIQKAASLGYGTESSSSGSSLDDALSSDEDTPMTLAARTLSEEIEYLRGVTGASVCELALFRDAVLLATARSDGAALARLQGNDTIDQRDPQWASIYRSANTMEPQLNDHEHVLPLELDEHVVVARLHEPAASSVVDHHERHLRMRSSGLWLQLWSSARVEQRQRQMLQRLVTTLGDRVLFVGSEGRGFTPAGRAITLPSAARAAAQEAMDRDRAVVIELTPETDGFFDAHYRLTAVASPELSTLHPDVEPVILLLQSMGEEVLQGRTRDATRELRLLRRLAGGLAHDVANLMMMFSVYIDDEHGGSAMSRAATEAMVTGQRLARRLTAIASSKPGQIDAGPLDLVEHLRRGSALLSRALDRRTRFVLELPAEPMMVIAEPGVVDRIVLNLLVNAKQAVGENGGQVWVRVVPDVGYAFLEVEDDGIGFDSAVAERLFQPGISGSGSTGLGLSVVQDEASSVGARVTVESKPGHGARFRIAFRRSGANENALTRSNA
ncbi:MAG: ATP-binding protein [Myxococcota bacterium]